MSRTQDELRKLLDELISEWENETVEFKETSAKDDDLGKYFSALSNEANLKEVDSAWIILGVSDRTRQVVGTDYRSKPGDLNQLQQKIAQNTGTGSSFQNIYELEHPSGRVLLLEVPAAPKGMPVLWKQFAYGRNGESIGALSYDKSDRIRTQKPSVADWSAITVPDATIDDLDEEALAIAKVAFGNHHQKDISQEELDSWDVPTFLNKANLMIHDELTHAALLLLGSPGASHLISPAPPEITWKLVGGEEEAYEHFGLPFLLNTTKVYERIRNYKVRMLPPGTLIQIEIEKYDKGVILEAIHNCVAHSNYASRGARIVIEEHQNHLVLINDGAFIDGPLDDYILHNKTPRIYRNPMLVRAMTELHMIDRMGYGIKRMHERQRERYLPLPDYNFEEDPETVLMKIYGGEIDQNYSQLLMNNSNLSLQEVLLLDRVQKGLLIPRKEIARLRKKGLIEGRKPHIHVSAAIAQATNDKARYIQNKQLDDEHYRKLIIEYLSEFQSATRKEIDDFIYTKLSDVLTEEEKSNKVSSLLTKLRRDEKIKNIGSRRSPQWVLTDNS
jgi:putative transcriptional regulator